ncbi:MAG: ubiquinol-cytochrome c reductase iron-sulfur subunit [Noviherbaspirillum sp.]
MADTSIPATSDEDRRRLLQATIAIGSIGTVASVVPFFASMAPSERAKAEGAAVTVDLTQIAPGTLTVVAWRGNPVWVLRRTDAMIESLRQHTDMLADPMSKRSEQPAEAKNALRSMHPDLSVLVGICTHLGCVPLFRPEVAPADLGETWFGGFYCPCHGSKFDLAGRVYKNVPAPLNLVVPPHYFVTDSLLTIGEKTT